MPSLLVDLQTEEPVMCSAGQPLEPGGLVLLSLNTVADPSLPATIRGVVQPAVPSRIKMLGASGCPVSGYRYVIAYDPDDLNDALDELPPDMVTAFRCVTCCELLQAQIDALPQPLQPLLLDEDPSGHPGQAQRIELTSTNFTVTFGGPMQVYVEDPRGYATVEVLAQTGDSRDVLNQRIVDAILDQSQAMAIIEPSIVGGQLKISRNVIEPTIVGFYAYVVPMGVTGISYTDTNDLPGILPSPSHPGLFNQQAFVGVGQPDPQVFVCVQEDPVQWVKLSN